MTTELYKKHRPKIYKDVLGQPQAVKTLIGMAKAKRFPHALLFVGGSGCGKTTLARITREKLKCGNPDFVEMDAASNRGIDMVRSIQKRMMLSPIAGPCRVWLIDECHMLTSEAQAAFLKILEDTPKHVYFMLATTDPQKLKPTIRTRCTTITVKMLRAATMETLIVSTAKKEGLPIEDEVVAKLIEYAEGSARKGLVLLNSISGTADTEDQLAAIEDSSSQTVAFDLARKLMDTRTKWSTIGPLLKELEDEPEGLRRMILGYARSVLLGGKNADRAYILIDAFRDHFFDSGKAGLAAACWEVVKGV